MVEVTHSASAAYDILTDAGVTGEARDIAFSIASVVDIIPGMTVPTLE